MSDEARAQFVSYQAKLWRSIRLMCLSGVITNATSYIGFPYEIAKAQYGFWMALGLEVVTDVSLLVSAYACIATIWYLIKLLEADTRMKTEAAINRPRPPE